MVDYSKWDKLAGELSDEDDPVNGVIATEKPITQAVRTGVILSHTLQDALQPVGSDDIRRFCAITPYAHTPALCRGTMGINTAPLMWLEARLEGILVGIAMLMIKGGAMAIQHMLVRPDEQNKGVGTQLLGYIQRRNANKMTILLSVRNDARVARFFTTRGFQYCCNETILRKHWKKPRTKADAPHKEHSGVLATCKLSVDEALAYSTLFCL
uniref:N-acetyltransferase domain-containing protein n=1 Tax=viral metagenome TaxID=1070528 RepID=A0A6C0KGH4_9ZZZZ